MHPLWNWQFAPKNDGFQGRNLQTSKGSKFPGVYRLVSGRKKPDKKNEYPRKIQHTPRAHPRQSPYPTMKKIPLQPIGKGLGVCSKGVLKQP